MATSMVSRCLIFRTLGDHCKRELHHRLFHEKLTCYAKSKSMPLSLPRRYASNTFATRTNKRPYRWFRWLLVTTGTGTLLYFGVRRRCRSDDHKLATDTQTHQSTQHGNEKIAWKQEKGNSTSQVHCLVYKT